VLYHILLRLVTVTSALLRASQADMCVLRVQVLGPELLVRFAQHLTSQYGKDSRVTALLDGTAIHMVPFVNADG